MVSERVIEDSEIAGLDVLQVLVGLDRVEDLARDVAPVGLLIGPDVQTSVRVRLRSRSQNFARSPGRFANICVSTASGRSRTLSRQQPRYRADVVPVTQDCRETRLEHPGETRGEESRQLAARMATSDRPLVGARPRRRDAVSSQTTSDCQRLEPLQRSSEMSGAFSFENTLRSWGVLGTPDHTKWVPLSGVPTG